MPQALCFWVVPFSFNTVSLFGVGISGKLTNIHHVIGKSWKGEVKIRCHRSRSLVTYENSVNVTLLYLLREFRWTKYLLCQWDGIEMVVKLRCHRS